MTLDIKVTSAAPPTPIRMAVYGLSGSGKTMLVATCPAPLLLNAERGLLSLSPENIAKVYGENQDWITYNVPYVDVSSIAKLREVYAWLQTPAAAVYKTVVIDSLSDIAEVVLSEALANPTVKDPRQAYGILGTDVLNLVRSFRDLPTHHHVVFLCKAEKVKDEVLGTTLVGPKFPGNMLSSGFAYLLDEVFGFEISNSGARQLRCVSNWQYQAKDRSGKLNELEYPSIVHILAKLGAPI